MRSLVFEVHTWQTYKELGQQDKKLQLTFNKLLKEMLQGDPLTGAGKPIPLKHGLSGLWSRRISQRDRVIYKYDEKSVYIFAIGGVELTR